MTTELKIVARQSFELIQSSDNILLHLHPKPDPDSIGSALATYHALRSIGKNATVIQGDSVLPEGFSFLPGYEHILKQSYFETDLSKFDLFIIQDSGATAMVSRKGEIVFPPHLKTIVIDHHITNSGFGDINIIDASYAATSEALFDLFKEWAIVIDRNMAACLYIGIFGDTGGFKYSSTTARTMEKVGELVKIYPDFPKLIHELECNNSKGRILFDMLAMNKLQTFFDDRVAISIVSFEEIQKLNLRPEDIDNNLVANNLITVKNWELGITLIEKEPNQVSVSLRTRGTYNVDQIAVGLGGGGHTKAGGAFLKMSLGEAQKKVLEAVRVILR